MAVVKLDQVQQAIHFISVIPTFSVVLGSRIGAPINGDARLSSYRPDSGQIEIANAYLPMTGPSGTRGPDAFGLAADSTFRVASQDGDPAAHSRAAISPPSAPIPTIRVLTRPPATLLSFARYDPGLHLHDFTRRRA